MSYSVKILADSIASDVRLTTLEVTFPRIVLAEFNTHRVFSRNSASSRAIPVEKNIERVLADPFVPAAFAKNQKGMQAVNEFGEDEQALARQHWLEGLRAAVERAGSLANIGVHKQWANRLLEPYAWHSCIVTATEWENFFALRCSPMAQPEIRTVAEMMRAVMEASTPEQLAPGGWHLPLVQPDELSMPDDILVKLSVARCARVSYLTHEGKRDAGADHALYDRLLQSGHMSPFEHAARVATDEDVEDFSRRVPIYGLFERDVLVPPAFYGNFRKPWVQHRKLIAGEAVFRGDR